MSRLAPFDKALVLILVPLWVVCFAMSVRTQIEGGAVTAVALSLEDGNSYPTLTGYFSPIFSPPDLFEQAGLQAGDRLIQMGDADLRGIGGFGFYVRVTEEAGPDLMLPLVFERDGETRETALPVSSMSVFRGGLPTSVALIASALFLLLRGAPTPMIRAYFYFAMTGAFGTGTAFGVNSWELYVSTGIVAITFAVYLPFLIRFLQRFPDDRMPKGRWQGTWPWFFSLLGVFFALLFTEHAATAEKVAMVLVAGGAATAIAVITYKFRQADPVARRQMKWVLLGFYCSALIAILGAVAPALDPRLGWLWWASLSARALVPLAIVISVVRFNLFDIDRVLSAAASYNILAALLGAGALILVPRIAEAVAGGAGVDPGASQVVLSLALAAVLVPAHRRLRPQIDRVFFKERYALDQGVADLLPTLSSCTDVQELTERAGAGLHLLLRPEACVVYAGLEQSYVPTFAQGRAVPPAFEAASPLIGTLRGRHAPLSLSDTGRRPDEAPLGPFDRAALETLQAEVVVPVRQVKELAAFLCLGPKRSGDVYTSTDLSLLTAVAETVARELRRFEQDETIREAREMQESLRRYVPGAIAEQLGSGGDLASGEREVSVLFVDIRGYTRFSESRRAEEIFSTINRYTETVSRIVRKHGGSVVEFNGDGMMTVFGAPRELAHKERGAVEAGREIVEAVAALPVEGGERLSVGVGIATGEAFVGNIQAVDRMIWSAIGNTTNLAARLQALTRELEAVVVIDSPTWECAQAAAAGFEKRPEVPIRGRRESQDVYVLPMQPGS